MIKKSVLYFSLLDVAEIYLLLSLLGISNSTISFILRAFEAIFVRLFFICVSLIIILSLAKVRPLQLFLDEKCDEEGNWGNANHAEEGPPDAVLLVQENICFRAWCSVIIHTFDVKCKCEKDWLAEATGLSDQEHRAINQGRLERERKLCAEA